MTFLRIFFSSFKFPFLDIFSFSFLEVMVVSQVKGRLNERDGWGKVGGGLVVFKDCD